LILSFGSGFCLVVEEEEDKAAATQGEV